MTKPPPPSDIEKAINAARAAGLSRFRVVKEGRRIVVEVDETSQADALDDEEKMRRASRL